MSEVEQANALSEIPCCKCGGEVVEFSVPNEAWNTIVRKGGPDQEYLCLDCFARCAAEEIERLRKETILLGLVMQERDELRAVVQEIETDGDNPDLWGSLVKQRDNASAKVERLQAIVNALPMCNRWVDGEPVPDVPVVPRMRIWLDCDTAGFYGQQPGKAVEAIVTDVSTPTTPVRIQFHNGVEWCILADRIWDSRDAAEHAAKAKGQG